MMNATGKLARWRLHRSELNVDIVYWAGIKHQAAGALSRLRTTGTDESPHDDDVLVLTITNERFTNSGTESNSSDQCDLIE